MDSLVVWDWTTGDLVRVRTIHPAYFFWCLHAFQVISQCGNHSFIFLSDNIIVAGRSTEDNRPSLAFFDLTSDENPAIPPPTLEYPYEDADDGTLRRMRLNLGIPIRHGPELQARVPFVVNHSQQMLLVTASFTDLDSVISRSIAIPVSVLRDLAQANVPLVRWEDWERHSVPMLKAGDTRRATFTMGSRFVVPEFAILVEPWLPFAAEPDASIALVHNMSPLRRMRVEWDPSMPHCQAISGVWNTVTTISDNGGYRRAMQVLNELPSDILMTEDSLIVVEMVSLESRISSANTHAAKYRTLRVTPGSRSLFYRFECGLSSHVNWFGHHFVGGTAGSFVQENTKTLILGFSYCYGMILDAGVTSEHGLVTTGSRRWVH